MAWFWLLRGSDMILDRAFPVALSLVLPLSAACTGTVSGGGAGETGGDGTGTVTSRGGDIGGSDTGTVSGGGSDTGGGDGGSDMASCTGPTCTVGDTQMSCCGEGYSYMCSTATCALVNGCPVWTNLCYTPLVISFDGTPVEYLADPSHAFQLSSAGPTPTDWPTAKTPWLALDRNGNGSIDDGSELFGSMTPLGEGRRAANGFEALLALDADGDGLLTERDPAFAELALWNDRDGDRRSSPGELVPVAQAGIVSIDLRYVSDPRCDGRGNCEVERGAIVYRDAWGVTRTGSVVDVHLADRR